jgi:hypothetical protein
MDVWWWFCLRQLRETGQPSGESAIKYVLRVMDETALGVSQNVKVRFAEYAMNFPCLGLAIHEALLALGIANWPFPDCGPGGCIDLLDLNVGYDEEAVGPEKTGVCCTVW